MDEPSAARERSSASRRDLLSWLAMGIGLLASYGLAAAFALRFLYPVRRERVSELFVATLDELPPGASREFTAPSGAEVFLHNLQGQVVAFSNVCPHLGCKVHWQAQQARFFCPCHNGVFDPEGRPVAGPPKAENKHLQRYEVVARGNAVYIRWKEA